jgi:hypothetical protein
MEEEILQFISLGAVARRPISALRLGQRHFIPILEAHSSPERGRFR